MNCGNDFCCHQSWARQARYLGSADKTLHRVSDNNDIVIRLAAVDKSIT